MDEITAVVKENWSGKVRQHMHTSSSSNSEKLDGILKQNSAVI